MYTKRLKRSVDFEPLYRCKLDTLLIYAECEPNINSINVGRFSDLKRFIINKNMLALSENALIESLCIYQVGKLDDLGFLSYFPNLKYLTVINGEIASMNGLSDGLISLTLKNVEILNSSPLRNAFRLENFCVEGLFPPSIIEELSFLSRLEYLKLDGFVELGNIAWVKQMPHLKVLILGCVIKDGCLMLLRKLPYVRLKIDERHYDTHDGDLSKNILNSRHICGIPVYKDF